MHNESWNFIVDGENPGTFNMWFDEQLVQRLIDGTGSSTLRLYRWKPWTISLGYHQRFSDVDAQRCKEDGIDIVRRPTGGRAILHAQELTYSIVMSTRAKSIPLVYDEISSALVEGLRLFGIKEVALQRSQPNFGGLYRNPSSIPCFSSSARNEIEWKERKLVGSAQRRYVAESIDVVLQHGSILCGSEHSRLAEYLALESEQIRARIRQDLAEKTTNLHHIIGREIDLQNLSECIKKGFESAWGITFAGRETKRNLMKEAYA